MKRPLFEFEDLPWFPDSIRRSMVDYLGFFLQKTGFYKPAVPLIAECLQHTEHQRIIDLCSGGGGPALQIAEDIKEYIGNAVPVILTDKFPNTAAYEYLSNLSGGVIRYEARPVDATWVPSHLKGVRTCFSALHHFSPEGVKKILRDAILENAPVAIFDGGDKNLLTVLGIVIGHPVLFFFCTPFLKPFRLSRLIFTYLIPIIPICTIWDGSVSITRLYRPTDLDKLVAETDSGKYIWKTGIGRNKLGFGVSYLIGYPKGG
jgi:hypothetical protein